MNQAKNGRNLNYGGSRLMSKMPSVVKGSSMLEVAVERD
jgi:hypothetical protein